MVFNYDNRLYLYPCVLITVYSLQLNYPLPNPLTTPYDFSDFSSVTSDLIFIKNFWESLTLALNKQSLNCHCTRQHYKYNTINTAKSQSVGSLVSLFYIVISSSPKNNSKLKHWGIINSATFCKPALKQFHFFSVCCQWKLTYWEQTAQNECRALTETAEWSATECRVWYSFFKV